MYTPVMSGIAKQCTHLLRELSLSIVHSGYISYCKTLYTHVTSVIAKLCMRLLRELSTNSHLYIHKNNCLAWRKKYLDKHLSNMDYVNEKKMIVECTEPNKK